jgi:hypothetical protein
MSDAAGSGTVTTGGQTTGDAGGGTSGTSGTATTGDWTSGLAEDMRGYVQSKGFKDPGSVVDSYRNLEKLMGAPKERLLRLPDKEDAPEWNDIYSRLGRPTDPKEYKLDVPPELGGPESFAWAGPAFHKAGISKRQAETLMGEWRQHAEKQMGDSRAQYQQKIDSDISGLKKEWGMAHDQNIAAAKIAAKQLGVTPEQIDQLENAMGFSGVIKMFHAIGTRTGEPGFVAQDTKGAAFGAMTPSEAQSRLSDKRRDPEFARKLQSGDAEVKREWETLHKFAYPET